METLAGKCTFSRYLMELLPRSSFDISVNCSSRLHHANVIMKAFCSQVTNKIIYCPVGPKKSRQFVPRHGYDAVKEKTVMVVYALK